MIGTATSSLCAFSTAACPPRLKMPTLYPVLPRLRVGMEGDVLGFDGSLLSERAISGRADAPSTAAVIAPLALRNARRLRLGRGLVGTTELRLLMATSGGDQPV